MEMYLGVKKNMKIKFDQVVKFYKFYHKCKTFELDLVERYFQVLN